MTYEDFLTSVVELAPGCKPEAVPRWRDFAVECVEKGQFVHFERTADKTAAVEKWLEVLDSGLHAVGGECGTETATALVNLSLENCCLYPGEMMQAALCLENGGNAEQILHRIETGEIDCTDLFSTISRRDAKARLLVREHLKTPPLNRQSKHKKGRDR